MFQKIVNKVYPQKFIKNKKSPFEKTLKKAIISPSDKLPIPQCYYPLILSIFQNKDSTISSTQASQEFESFFLKNKKFTKSWVCILRFLMLLDFLLEENVDIPFISSLNPESFLRFQKKNPIIPLYYSFVKYKAHTYLETNYAMKKQITMENLENFENLQGINELIFELISVCEQGLLNYPIIRKIFEDFSQFLFSFYTCQFNTFVKMAGEKFFSYELEKAWQIRKLCEIFIKNTKNFKGFLSKHQYIKEIQGYISKIIEPEEGLLGKMDDYISVLEKKQQMNANFNQSVSKIGSETHIDEEIIESERGIFSLDFQRKKDIFMSPIKAHFINSSPLKKPWEKYNKNRHSSPLIYETQEKCDLLAQKDKNFTVCWNDIPEKKFKFIEKNDGIFCQEIFEKFENQYSQKYRGSILELADFEFQDFELQVKFNKLDRVLFRRQTVDVGDYVEFGNASTFNEDLWKKHRNFYSGEFSNKGSFYLVKDELSLGSNNKKRKV